MLANLRKKQQIGGDKKNHTLIFLMFSYESKVLSKFDQDHLFKKVICCLGNTLFTQRKNTPEYAPVFYRIGTDYFHILTYEDRIRKYTDLIQAFFRYCFGTFP